LGTNGGTASPAFAGLRPASARRAPSFAPLSFVLLGGLALTSHNNSVLTTAEFTDVIVK
jgi:hypothetical protein